MSGEAALVASGVLMEWICGNGAEVEAVDVEVIPKCEVWDSAGSLQAAATTGKGRQAVNGEVDCHQRSD